MFTKAYSAPRIFTGERWLDNYAIIVVDERIEAIVPLAELPSGIEKEVFSEEIIAPAFLDLQLYGAGGRLFSAYPEADSLFLLEDHIRKGGAFLCLPTVATNSYEVFHSCIDALREYWNMGGAAIPGLHIEGPWINSTKRGAHQEDLIHSPTMEQVKDLLDYAKGAIKMITLAPEVCSAELIELIMSQGIIVSAGHSNASYEQAMSSFQLGVGVVTHLYNAMSPLQHRAPGLVGAAMDNDTVMASIIPDGHHVDFAAVRIAKSVMKERLFAITDSVTETGIGPYQHQLVGDRYESGGVLSGSAIYMNQALQNLHGPVGIELGEALRMCSLYPAGVLGMESRLGKLENGYAAKMVVLSKDLSVNTVIG